MNLEEDVQSGQSSGLSCLHFLHNPLPEIDLAEVDCRLHFLGKPLRAPHPHLLHDRRNGEARRINRALAEAAQQHGVALGLGPSAPRSGLPLADTYQVRDLAPDILLLANLGAVQLNYGYDVNHCRRAVEMIAPTP